MLALALVVRRVAGQYVHNPPVASLAPVVTVGTYYACTTSYHFTQTEALVGLPLLMSLVAAVTAVRPGSRRPLAWLFVSGLAAGVVFAFKAPYVVLPLLFWLLVGMWRRGSDRSVPVARKMARALLAGALLPVSALVVYLALKPGLGLVWWTFVVHHAKPPAKAVSTFSGWLTAWSGLYGPFACHWLSRLLSRGTDCGRGGTC